MNQAPSTPRFDENTDVLDALSLLIEPDCADDVRDVIDRNKDMTIADMIELLVLDQAKRWRLGQRVPAEAYLQLNSALHEDSDEAFELVYSEFVLRDELGERPSLAEYVWRFPQFAERLARQSELFQTLSDTDQLLNSSRIDPHSQNVQASASPHWPRIDGFEIERELGRGGMGVVYAARQLGLDRIVALKLIRDGALADREQRQRFRREAEAVARLQHPNIVQIHEIGEQDGLLYLCLEFVAGGSLADQLKGIPQPPREAARLIQTLSQAAAYAHRLGIIHRDLKPANILIAADGRGLGASTDDEVSAPLIPGNSPLALAAKIADFGLAKRIATEDPSVPGSSAGSAIVGTAEYMAPEQAQGKGAIVGPAADIYALGAILYEMLIGRPPFRGESAMDTVLQSLHSDPVAPRRLQPRVPRDLETVCLKCLAKEPSRRYAGAEALADDLRRYLSGEPIRARPARTWERAFKWARRRPALAALYGVSIVATIALLVGGLWYSNRLRLALDRMTSKEEQARTSYREARDAITQMLKRLEDPRFAELPRLKELRRKQLEDALAFYQGVRKDSDLPDPALRVDAAHALRETAELQFLLGNGGAAKENFQQALSLYKQAEHESHDELTSQLIAHHVIGCLRRVGLLSPERSDTERYYREALAKAEVLSHTLSPDHDWQGHVVLVSEGLANLYRSWPGRADEAEAWYRRAIDFGEQLIRTAQESKNFRDLLATPYLNLGEIYHFSQPQRAKEAEQAYQRVIELMRTLTESPSADEIAVFYLASAYGKQGNLRMSSGRAHDALAPLGAAITLVEPIHRREPQLTHLRSHLWYCHGVRAYAFKRLGRYADALTDFDRLIELSADSARDFRRSERAECLALAGKHVEALSEARALADGTNVSWEVLYNSASAANAAISASRLDMSLPMAERDRLAEEYAAFAVELFTRVHATGKLTTDLIKPEVVHETVRSHSDFQRLVAELKAKDK